MKKKIRNGIRSVDRITRIAAVVCLVASLLLVPGCQKLFDQLPYKGKTIPPPTSKDIGSVATDWFKLQLRMILQANPAKANIGVNRLFAYSGISLYEAARFSNKDLKTLQSQLYEMPVMPQPDNGMKYSWVITANAALASITRDLFPGLSTANNASIDSLEKVYTDQVTITDGADVVSRSTDFGNAVVASIFTWSKTDLYDHINDPYTPPVFPGAWIPTPPAFAAATAPYAGNCRTFLHIFSEGTTPPPPFAYSEDPGSDFYKMVDNVYQVSKTLTTDQKNIALFWNDVGAGVAYTPMGHSISILTQILDNSGASLATAAVAYAKAGIAIWDGTVVCWRSKYKYNQIRPVSYIQAHIDNTWLPLLTTPSHPEYPAAHAFITSAIMSALTSVFGNHYSFTDHSYDFRGYAPRSYSSFDDAALECGQSRVYGGIHYQPSVDIGHQFGSIVGDAVGAIEMMK
ncbi:MAG TPA: vanadium-dependent haloperoxidase [Puia sp.]|nr:vanadium-dependent haloperoxidase [Puia sp.]